MKKNQEPETAPPPVNLEVIELLDRMSVLARESGELFSVAVAFAISPEHGGKAVAGPLSMTMGSVCTSLANEMAQRPFDQAVRDKLIDEAQEQAKNGKAKPTEAATEA